MQAMLDIFFGIVGALVAAAFAQFGVTLQSSDDHASAPEVHRTADRAAASEHKTVYVRPGADTASPPAPRKGV